MVCDEYRQAPNDPPRCAAFARGATADHQEVLETRVSRVRGAEERAARSSESIEEMRGAIGKVHLLTVTVLPGAACSLCATTSCTLR